MKRNTKRALSATQREYRRMTSFLRDTRNDDPILTTSSGGAIRSPPSLGASQLTSQRHRPV